MTKKKKKKCKIYGNTVSTDTSTGIWLSTVNFNTVSNNICTGNTCFISLEDCENGC